MMPMYWNILLAQAGKPNAPRPGDWTFGWTSVAMLAAASLAIIVVAWIVSRSVALRQRRIKNSPSRLFKDLCLAHNLTNRERQMLGRMAQQFRLLQPAALFVEPAWWEAERLGPSWSRRMHDVERLRKRLFAVR
jgi:hypothetical protein